VAGTLVARGVDQMVVDASRAPQRGGRISLLVDPEPTTLVALQIPLLWPVLGCDVISFHSKGGIYRGRDEIDRIAGVDQGYSVLTSDISRSLPGGDGNGGRIRWVSGSLESRRLRRKRISSSPGMARLRSSTLL